jgi:hypothetical protein
MATVRHARVDRFVQGGPMLHHRLTTFALFSFIALAACDDSSTGIGSRATVRFVNASNSSLDVATGNVVATGNGAIAFGGSSTCIATVALAPDLEIRQAGTTNVVAGLSPTFAPGGTYTVVAYPGFGGATQFAIFSGTFTPATGQAGLRVIHAAPGAGAFDVYVTAPGAALGTATATNVAFGTATSFVSVPAGTELIRLTNAGTQTVAINTGNQTLTAGQSYILVIAPPAPGTTALRSFLVSSC